jgi:hypothetical protein
MGALDEPMTSTVPSDKPEPTLDEMLAGVEQAFRIPMPIGTLHGEVVMLNRWERTLSIGNIHCSVDHPYLKGTKIQDAALEALGEKG